MSSVLSFSRLMQLVSNDLRANRKITIISGIIILMVWLLTVLKSGPGMHQYFFILYVVGFIITSRSFKEIHHAEMAYHYLTLPCSNFERFLSKWLLTAVIFPLALLALYFVFTSLFYWVLAGAPHLFSGLDISDGYEFAKYIILHSIFFMGAIIFKRYALLKTLLVCSLPSMMITLLTGAVLAYSFPFWVPATIEHFDTLSYIIYGLFWFVLAPFCWIVAYLRLTECEIE